MKSYAGNIMAAIVGAGAIASVPITKYFNYGMSETLNIVCLATGGVLIAGSIASAVYKARKTEVIA